MTLAMQVKLLRVIQEKEVLPVGGTKPLKIDVRFIAASNRNMKEWVADGRFRQDLYFRLNVVNLHIPPLSQRREDIPLLAQHFLDRAAPVMGKPVRGISEEALALLKAYDFPGNVRELENIIERGVALCQGDTLEAAHLPDDLRDLSIRAFRRRDGKVIPAGRTGTRLHPLGTGRSPRQPDFGGTDAGHRPGFAVAEVEEVWRGSGLSHLPESAAAACFVFLLRFGFQPIGVFKPCVPFSRLACLPVPR
jgi:DNA-binding NtrC family response regulator